MSRNINGSPNGELPATWQMKRLGEIATVATGGTPSRENTAYWNGTIPWITTSLIDFGVIQSAEEFITPEAVANSAAKILPQGTLLMAMFGQGVTRGKVAILGIDAAFNQACVGITPLPVADPTYLFHFLFFKYKSIRTLANSGSQENLNAGLIKGIEINVPPLAEQKAIAGVLSAWDRAIERTTALIAAKERLKQGLMQKLLSGTKRFKGSTTNWITCHIGDLLTEVRRYVTVEDDISYRLVSVRRNSGGMFDREPRPGRDIGYSKLMTVEAGDFLIARRQVIHGAMTIVRKRFHGAYVSDAYAVLIPKFGVQLHMPFLDILSQAPRMYYSAFRCSYGVAIEKMVFHLEWFLREKVTIPPTIEEQKRIADVFTELDREVRQLERRHSALQKQKRGVMQKLLTGERRVSPKLLRRFSHD